MARPMFTKRHFEALARIFKGYVVQYDPDYARPIVDDFCELFEEENEAFDRKKFLKACGL